MEIKDQIKQELEGIKTGLEGTISENVKNSVQKAVADVQKALETGNKDAIATAVKENMTTINQSLKEFADWKGEKTEADAKNQKALDDMLSQLKAINKNTSRGETKGFSEALCEALNDKDHQEGIKSVGKNKPYKIVLKNVDLKSASNMLTSDHLTGSGVITYNQRQAILPAQKVNFRDLIPATHSDTGLYVTYQENGGNTTLGTQTEGAAKTQVDYTFANVQTVNGYLAGFARFAKQMMRNLPWLQTTLPRLLLRDFYKQENASFFSTASSAASGNAAATEADDVKALIDFIAQQQAANYNASFALVNNLQLARLNKLFYSNLKYPGIGGIATGPDGQTSIAGVPVIAAPWVTNHKVLVIDTDYIERVEVESIAVEFFEQDSDNIQKNLITARIECYEALNAMLGASMIYGDFGGNS